jgi:hypothetical protein
MDALIVPLMYLDLPYHFSWVMELGGLFQHRNPPESLKVINDLDAGTHPAAKRMH